MKQQINNTIANVIQLAVLSFGVALLMSCETPGKSQSILEEKGEVNKSLPLGSESSNIAALTDDERQQFFEQGYIIKKGVFDSHALAHMEEGCNRLVEKANKLSKSSNWPIGQETKTEYEGTQFVLTKKPNNLTTIQRIVSCCGASENSLKPYMEHPNLLAVFSKLLGTTTMEQLICQFHPKLPGDGVVFRPHRDIHNRLAFDPAWKDVNGTGSYVVAIIAIDKMSPENGGLFVIEGSNKGYIIGTDTKESLSPLETLKQDLHIKEVHMEPGDVLFMQPYLIHWSNPNLSSMSRRTLLTGFCSPGANHKAYPGKCVNKTISVNTTNINL